MSLEEFNYKLYKTSKGRFELRLSKNNRFYLYDYDDTENRLSRDTLEIKDILECMNLYDVFLESREKFYV